MGQVHPWMATTLLNRLLLTSVMFKRKSQRLIEKFHWRYITDRVQLCLHILAVANQATADSAQRGSKH
jgi:hypothetical protein